MLDGSSFPKISHQDVSETGAHTPQPVTNVLSMSPVFHLGIGDPLDDVKYEKRRCLISEKSGAVVFQMDDVEIPSGWSQLATDIVASKYFRKAGVPQADGTLGPEKSVKQVIHRVASTIAQEGFNQGYFTLEQKQVFERELKYLLVHQYGAFNSPVWFNVGMYHSYGIDGQGGNFAWDFESGSVKKMDRAYVRPQASACFINRVDDSIDSIADSLKAEMRLFKYGSGVGSDFSAIRSKYEVLSGGGYSSGLMAFLRVFDRAADSMKSGGTTRRAAKMVILQADHPEIEDFVTWKSKEENKARVLLAAGIGLDADGKPDFNGEAYATISGQNSNNSVRVSDEFMRAVEKDEDWNLRARTTGEVIKTIKAKDLWQKICQSAWECADPGLQYDTTINDWHTCAETGRINASNPCSEFIFLDNTSCNLASLNLTKFLKRSEDGSLTFDVKLYREAARIFIIAQEILVDLASYPTEEITRNTHDFRPLGLGYANLGTLLMMLGLPYDSYDGRYVAGALTAIMHSKAYATSAELAKLKGAFPKYQTNLVPMSRVVQKHSHAIDDLTKVQPINSSRASLKFSYLGRAAREDADNMLKLGATYGYRNAQVTVLAPTGTIGYLMDCDTTGIEPDYSLVKYKKLAGGGSMKIVNQSVHLALHELGYGDEAVDAIVAHIDATGNVMGAPHLDVDDYPVFACAQGVLALRPMAHLEMMAATQPFLSGAISKTCNMPNNSTVEEVSEIYRAGWKLGLKAVALYRDGCKASQPLTDKKKTPTTSLPTAVAAATSVVENRPTRVRLPRQRKGYTQEAKIAGQKLYLHTGEYPNGNLGEIFIDVSKDGAALRAMLNSFAIAISVGLQHGVPLDTYVNQFTFTRFEPAGPVQFDDHIKTCTSLLDYIFRHLAVRYLDREDLAHIKPSELAAELTEESEPSPAPTKRNSIPPAATSSDAPFCDQCGHLTVRNGTCYRCSNCGSSMGCS